MGFGSKLMHIVASGKYLYLDFFKHLEGILYLSRLNQQINQIVETLMSPWDITDKPEGKAEIVWVALQQYDEVTEIIMLQNENDVGTEIIDCGSGFDWGFGLLELFGNVRFGDQWEREMDVDLYGNWEMDVRRESVIFIAAEQRL